MKQFLLILISILIASLSAKAQIRFAPEIGMKQTYTNYDQSNNITYIPFGSTLIQKEEHWMPHIGVNISYPILKKVLHLSSGVFWSQARSTHSILTFSSSYEYRKVNLQYLSIPLLITAKLPIKQHELFLSAGPYLTYTIAAKEYILNRGLSQLGLIENTIDLPINNKDNSGNVKQLQTGANISMGFGHRTGLQFKTIFNIGFTDSIVHLSSNAPLLQFGSITFAIAYQF